MEHSHLIIRAEVKKPFTKPKQAREWLKKLVKDIGMTICKHGGPHVDYVKKPGNFGIAGVVMIETSHIALHVWDQNEPPLVQLDVYSCSRFDTRTVEAALKDMEPTEIHTLLLDRKTEIKWVEEMHDTRDYPPPT